MPDDFSTEVVSYSFGHRIWHAILIVFLGPLFIISAAILIYWNEGNTIHTANSLREGAAILLEADGTSVDPSLDGKLVHLSRDLRAEGTLRDPQFGVKTSGVRLLRHVEVYEWTENRRSEKHNNTTVYYYDYRADWHDDLKSSSSFHDHFGHENPTRLAYNAAEYNAPIVRLGAYQVDPKLLSKFTDTENLTLAPPDVQLPPGAQLMNDGRIYVGRDPHSPRVGDLRIAERRVPAGAASVVAGVVGERLTAYHTHSGKDIALVKTGTVDAPAMFAAAMASNSNFAWIWRGLGLLGLYIGLRCIVSPLSTLASYVPIFGTLFEEGLGFISLLGAGVLWLLLVAVSWLAARPLLGGALLVSALLGIGWLVSRLIRNAAARRARLAGGLPMSGGMPPAAGVQ